MKRARVIDLVEAKKGCSDLGAFEVVCVMVHLGRSGLLNGFILRTPLSHNFHNNAVALFEGRVGLDSGGGVWSYPRPPSLADVDIGQAVVASEVAKSES
jgi:hypothetical protein